MGFVFSKLFSSPKESTSEVTASTASAQPAGGIQCSFGTRIIHYFALLFSITKALESPKEPGGPKLVEDVLLIIWGLLADDLPEKRWVPLYPKAIGNTIPAIFHISRGSRRIAMKNYERFEFYGTNETIKDFALIFKLNSDTLFLN